MTVKIASPKTNYTNSGKLVLCSNFTSEYVCHHLMYHLTQENLVFSLIIMEHQCEWTDCQTVSNTSMLLVARLFFLCGAGRCSDIFVL